MYTERQSTIADKRCINLNDDYKLDFYSILSTYIDLDNIAKLINKHITNNNRIICVVDKDADGLNAGAVLHKGFKDILNYDNIKVIISKRIDGNGVNDFVTEQLLDLYKTEPFSLVITADMGSSDNKNLNILKSKLNVDTIITDHHAIPKDDYPIVDGFINPERVDNKEHLPISGCFVAFLTIVATKLEQGDFDKEIFNTLLPHVGITTLTDVISLKYPINRQVVKVALNEMNSLRNPLWKILKKMSSINTLYNDVTIGYILGPLFNTGNRTNNEELVLELLITKDTNRMVELITMLQKLSNKRKREQKILYKDALQQILGSKAKANTPIIKTDLAINGIIASKLTEFNNKPSICFVDNGSGFLDGSARGIGGDLNIVDMLKAIDNKDNSILVKYGGHKQAAGCKIRKDKLDIFRSYLDEAISAYPVVEKQPIDVDLVIKASDITPELVEELDRLRPAGKDAQAPILKSTLNLDRVYDYKALFKFIFTIDNRKIEGLYFKNTHATFDHNNVTSFFNDCNTVDVIYNLEYNNFSNSIILQLRIIDVIRR